MELLGKRLVVIGGTSGLGLSAARAFVASGATVVVAGRSRPNAERAAQLLGQKAIVLTADARDPATASRAIAQSVMAFGGFDGLYHAAGSGSLPLGDGPLHEMSDAAWRGAFDLNLTTMMYSNRAAIRQFL